MSNLPRLTAQEGEGYLLEGDLNHATLPSLLQESAPLFTSGNAIRIDLSGVGASDSSGVALLLEWMRYARQNEVSITYINVPAQMQAIIEVSDLDTRLPVEAS